MGTKEIKAVQDILSNKNKFRRAIAIIIIFCLTLILIAGIGFYTGAITWHGGKEKIEKRND